MKKAVKFSLLRGINLKQKLVINNCAWLRHVGPDYWWIQRGRVLQFESSRVRQPSYEEVCITTVDYQMWIRVVRRDRGYRNAIKAQLIVRSHCPGLRSANNQICSRDGKTGNADAHTRPARCSSHHRPVWIV